MEALVAAKVVHLALELETLHLLAHLKGTTAVLV